MSLIVYNRDFSDWAEIANAVSVQWSVYYNDVGKIILDVPMTPHNAQILRNDCLVYDTSKKHTFIIKNVHTSTENNRITANGYTANHLMSQRVVATQTNISNVESGIYLLVNNNLRGLPRIAFATAKGLTERTQLSLYGGNLLDNVLSVLSGAGLGHKMVWDHKTKQYAFEIYKGNDLTSGIHAVVFSDEQGTARNLIIDEDVSLLKNVGYGLATYQERQIVETVGSASGENRHEAWFEINLNAEDGQTETQFRENLRNHIAMELGKTVRKLSFKVSIDPSEFGVLYGLGDIVSCVSKRFGIKFTARVIGVQYTRDANSEVTSIILKEPTFTF